MVLLGICLLLLATVDVLVTTLTVKGGGPLTTWISACIWRRSLQIHQWKPNHRLLVMTGRTILVGLPVLWFSLTWLGWTLIFSAVETAVMNTQTDIPASFTERIYFTGYTLSTLGLGDFEPKGAIWQIVTAIASTNGFFLISLCIAYLLPVVSAATQQRQLSLYIAALGGSPDEIISRAWNGKDFGQFDQHLIALTPLVVGISEKYLTYPILHYFHSVDRSRVLAQSLVALDEALTFLLYGVEEEARPDPAALRSARRACSVFLKTLRSAYIDPAPESPPPPCLGLLYRAQIPTVKEREFYQGVELISQRRQLLLALLHHDGWTWDSVASTQTTTRTQEFDDVTMAEKGVLD